MYIYVYSPLHRYRYHLFLVAFGHNRVVHEACFREDLRMYRACRRRLSDSSLEIAESRAKHISGLISAPQRNGPPLFAAARSGDS